MRADVGDAFAAASCRGWLCVQRADPTEDPTAEVAIGADEPVVAASVIKVLIAVAAESAFAAGRLDPSAAVRLRADHRTPGPVGMSLYDDDVVVSRRDLVTAMLTISDNVATDALIELVGPDACNALAGDLGLRDTVLVGTLDTMITGIARDAGFADWATMTAWSDAGPPADEAADVDRRVRASAALDPALATRTTARDMCTLLRSIWDDRAGPPTACARVRTHLSRQLTRHRLGSAFEPPWRVAAKSGGLLGVVRNEVGVVEYPAIDGKRVDRYYAAVFTRSTGPDHGTAVDAAIGTAAARAVLGLRGSRPVGP